MVVEADSAAVSAADVAVENEKNATGQSSPELISTVNERQGAQPVRERSPHPAQQRQQTRGVFSLGHVKRMAQAHEATKNGSAAPRAMGDVTSSATSPGIPKYVAKTASSGESSSFSVNKRANAHGVMADRYDVPSRSSVSTRRTDNDNAQVTKGSQKTRNNTSRNNARNNKATVAEGAALAPVIPSLLSNDERLASIAFNSNEQEFVETDLFHKFEEAFLVTLKNNPGILPGAPSVINSVKSTMFKVQKAKAQKESDLRAQLDKVTREKDQLEAQLRKEMGAAALRKNQLAKELEVAMTERDAAQDSLSKQSVALLSIKKELTLKMTEVTAEKEELTKHLGYLSKSRGELEKALETEMSAAEKDRDELQRVVAERKRMQKQKAENKELEGKIERMAQAASNEKKALSSEVADLKKFEEHISHLKKQNDEARQSLERERVQLKEIADEMQVKKAALSESKKAMVMKYQEEIDELRGQIESAKMMHEKDMEMVVKSRVMGYLRRTCGGAESGDGGMEAPAIECIGMIGGCNEGDDGANFEALIQSKVEAQVQAQVQAQVESRLREVDNERKEAELQARLNELEREAMWQARLEELEHEKMFAESELEKGTSRKSTKSRMNGRRSTLSDCESDNDDEDGDSSIEKAFSDDDESIDIKNRSKRKYYKMKLEEEKKKWEEEKQKLDDEIKRQEEEKKQLEEGKNRLEKEMKKKKEDEQTRLEEEEKRIQEVERENVLRKEIESLRSEIELVKARNAASEDEKKKRDEMKRSQFLKRAHWTPRANLLTKGLDLRRHDAECDLRDEILLLRNEMKMGLPKPRALAIESVARRQRGRFMSPGRSAPLHTSSHSANDSRDEIHDLREDIKCLRDEIMTGHATPQSNKSPPKGHAHEVQNRQKSSPNAYSNEVEGEYVRDGPDTSRLVAKSYSYSAGDQGLRDEFQMDHSAQHMGRTSHVVRINDAEQLHLRDKAWTDRPTPRPDRSLHLAYSSEEENVNPKSRFVREGEQSSKGRQSHAHIDDTDDENREDIEDSRLIGKRSRRASGSMQSYLNEERDKRVLEGAMRGGRFKTQWQDKDDGNVRLGTSPPRLSKMPHSRERTTLDDGKQSPAAVDHDRFNDENVSSFNKRSSHSRRHRHHTNVSCDDTEDGFVDRMHIGVPPLRPERHYSRGRSRVRP